MSDLLQKYLTLQTEMAQAERAGDEELFDQICEAMDDVWLRLTDREHKILNMREEL